VDYRVSVILFSTVAQLAVYVWPFLALVLTSGVISGTVRWLNLASVLILLALCWANAPLAGVRRWHGIGFPIASLLFLYILWRAMLMTLWNDGIDWRGTHYDLASLKANKV
jgi:uncharacterized membrane protein YhaH (DUF805 family)